MTEIRFYQLRLQSLERVLPKLLEKILGSDARAVVLAGSEERVEALNTALWTYDPASFLPHGCASDGCPEEQPVWLTDRDENPNRATVLILTDGARSQEVERFEKCLEIFDGNNPEAVAAARARWKDYKEAGFATAYFEQGERGGWERKE